MSDGPKPSQHRLVSFLVISGAVAITVIIAGLGMRSWLGWVLVISVIFGWLWMAGVLLVTRQLSTRSRPPASTGRSTGRTVAAAPAVDASKAAKSLRWVGGGLIPGSIGNVNATWPLAMLLLRDHELILRVRPRAVTALFGVHGPVRVTTADQVTIFPARGWFGVSGIGIQAAASPACYFYCRDRARLLSTLDGAGFHVTWEEQRIRYV